jgi:D-alanine transaminase
MEALGYYDGTWGPLDEMTIPMNDRSVYFGDGIYEAAVRRNGVIFTLEEHISRFFTSATLMRIEPTSTRDELAALLNDLAGKVDADPALVYWQWSRGSSRRNHTFPELGTPDCRAKLLVMVKPISLKKPTDKVSLTFVEDKRFELCNIKTLNLIPNVLAAQTAKENGCTEAVFYRLNPDNPRLSKVTECSHSNVHIIKDGVLYTHPADNHILRGIGRTHLLANCTKLGIPYLEKAFTVEDLKQADEVIITSATTIALAAESYKDGADQNTLGGRADNGILLSTNNISVQVNR